MTQALSTRRKGDLAELYVASLFLAVPHLEVFKSLSDDGHGSDLAIRSSRTQRWYSVQVKAAAPTANPFVYLDRFRTTSDYLLAAVALNEAGAPEQVFLVLGTAWDTDASGCLGRNQGGGKSGPYVEVRSTAKAHAVALSAYAIERVLPTL